VIPGEPARPTPESRAAATWDAGAMGCGELVLELRFRLADLPAGARFHLIATDPGAPEDLPAWCRMTGHRLLTSEPPHYWIERC
jgi:tRNA 2-thiouridine synthesizing protein A